MTDYAGQTIDFTELAGFFAAQQDATRVADTHKYTLYGGARGPGKSYWLRWYLVRSLLKWAGEGHRGVRVMLASRDYPSLTERHITKIRQEFPSWLGWWHGGEKEFRLHGEWGGGVIALRNLDSVSKYKSAEFALIAVDELTENSFSTFNMLRGSLRWPGIDDVRFVSASNPDGRYRQWVRALWVEGRWDDERFADLAPLADEFRFVAALPTDNPYLDKAYWNDLQTQPEHVRKAWLEGDWFVSAVGLVYSEFGAGNLTHYEPDPELPVELAFDDGYIDPRAVLFIQRRGAHIYVFDEVYHSRYLAEETVEMVVDRLASHFGWADADKTRPAVLPEIAVGSPEAKELQRRFRQANIPARFAAHRVVEGVKTVRRLMRDGKEHRALQVDPRRCPNLINEITNGYQYPPQDGRRRDDEKPLDGNDHACDALRYWCHMRAR